MQGHREYAQVLSSIRQRFWITHGAAAIKRVLRMCFMCRKLNATPEQHIMAPLPTFRSKPGWFPFMDVGIYYFGPIATKHCRSLEKRYGCLITCLQSRAVHNEVAYYLSTNSLLMALLRFVARRGISTDLYSDNGSNLFGAHKELMQWMDGLEQDALDRQLFLRDIQWHFHPPYSSYRGRVWKRVIRSVRRILDTICREQHLTDESLITTMTEIKQMLNARPIVPVVSDDINSVALTQNVYCC